MTNASDTKPTDEPISDEVLMAYVDGELPEEERKALQAALARDAPLMQRLESFVFTRGPLLPAYNAVLSAPIPERISQLLAVAEPPVPRRTTPSGGSSKLRRIVAGFWAPFLSPAAAIPVVVAGAAVGWLLARGAQTEFVSLDSRGGLVASVAMQAALESTPKDVRAGAGSSLVLEPTFTFATAKGGWCRQYRLFHRDGQAASGVACRDQGVWRVIAQTPVAPRADTTGKTVPAGEDEGVVGEIRSALKDGDVLGRNEEAQLIRERWPDRPQTR